MKIDVLDHGYVELVDTWGSDERIIEAARMSTDKGFQGWGPYPCPNYNASVAMITEEPCHCGRCDGMQIPGDEKLLRFLWENRHHTPFEMAGLTIEVQAPIFVFREWHRHRTQSYNELSARYTPLPDLFYLPTLARLEGARQSKANKQGSEGGLSAADAQAVQSMLFSAYNVARSTYEELLSLGVAREVARLVIPVSQYSRMRASANLRNWLGFLILRTDKAAQWEIRQFANVVRDVVVEKFPRTAKLFLESQK